MKKFVVFIFSFIFSFSCAQQLSDYKYIALPEKFSDFDKGQYQLENYLRLLLGQKDYVPLPEQHIHWPEEARLNPCLVLTTDVIKVAAAFRNKIKINFKDCNQTLVSELHGESHIKEFDAGYKDALKNAWAQAKNQNAVMPSYREAENQQITIVKSTETEHPARDLFRQHSNQNTQPTQQSLSLDTSQLTAWEYNGQVVYTTPVVDGEFKVVDASKSKILANYYPSTRAGIYHVKVVSGNTSFTSIGYYDGNNLSYEYTADWKTWTLVNFIKK
ncbi:MAG: hypothetical protein Q4G27_09505 [Flavobacteriaceae bacterium]|nr:hypothetical protein [Flavobacteriaceae bacterium]